MTPILFTKMLKNTARLSLEEAAECIADLGLEGADLTVREGGYVDPGAVESALPDAVETLGGYGLNVPLITTHLTSADDPGAEAVFRTAAEQGVDFLKLGYWPYDGFGRLSAQLDEMREDLDGIAELSDQHAVTPVVHIHSADFLNAEPGILWDVLGEFDPGTVGVYADPGHMALEGGVSGWKQGLDLMQDAVSVVAVKNFGYVRTETADGTTWESTKFSIEDGLTPWTEVFDCLDSIGYDGPLSIHSEYYDLDFDELLAQTRADLDYLSTIDEAVF